VKFAEIEVSKTFSEKLIYHVFIYLIHFLNSRKIGRSRHIFKFRVSSSNVQILVLTFLITFPSWHLKQVSVWEVLRPDYITAQCYKTVCFNTTHSCKIQLSAFNAKTPANIRSFFIFLLELQKNENK